MIDHLDESGQVCQRHPAVDLERIMQLAAVGSCAARFNHDLASKLQGVMMAVDEIAELAPGDAGLGDAVASARSTLQELVRLLAANRELAKPPLRSRIAVRELVVRAGARVDVAVHGVLPDAAAELAVPLAFHGVSLALDVAAGAGRGRSLEMTSSDGALTAAFASTPIAGASESLAIAAWMLARTGCELRCTSDDRLMFRFPPSR